MDSFISYDINIRHTEVKHEMLDLGYFDKWTFDNKTYHLPKTSLWKKGRELNDALKDIQGIIIKLNSGKSTSDKIILERCIVTSVNPWAGIEGIPIS